MSFWDDLFKSPRQTKSQELYDINKGDYTNLVNDSNAVQSIYSDPARMAQIGQSVNQQFGAARSNVATSNARARSAAARRMGASSATPEMTYGNIDASFAPAYGQVEAAAQNQIGNVLGEQDQFSFNKLNARRGALSSKQQSIQDYLNSLSDTSTAGDIFRGVTSVAGIPTGKDSTVLSSVGKWIGL